MSTTKPLGEFFQSTFTRAEAQPYIDELPEPLRKRIAFFEEGRAEWWTEMGTYEVFTCTEAVKIAALGSGEAIQAFARNFNTQHAKVPTLSSEHSGNTFHMACRLAALLVERPDLVPKEHAAICGLLGCEECGCFAARREAIQ